MLVLTRRNQERIRIGDATVTVLLAANGRVRLGIEAPPNVVVFRLGKVSKVLEIESEVALQSFAPAPPDLQLATA